jgi:WD40 repeat protein
VISLETGSTQVILAGHRDAVLDADFSPDGQLLVTASADGTARLWDANRGTEKAILRSQRSNSQEDTMKRAFFSPDGHYVATLSSGGQVDMWVATWQGLMDLARDRSLRQLKPEECLRYLRLPPSVCPALELQAKQSNPG